MHHSRHGCLRYVLVSWVMWVSCVQAGVSLDKLTACDDIEMVYRSLREGVLSRRVECRTPRGTLERELVKRTGLSASQVCFLESSPARFVDGFTCARPQVEAGASLVCFRAAAADDIRSYYGQFDAKYAAEKAKYLAGASACSVTNKDSGDAQGTLMSLLLFSISRFEFGYFSGLGKAKVPDSIIVHGYAFTDPTLPSSAASAIEFVHVQVGGSTYVSTAKPRTFGNWVVKVDDADRSDAGFNEEARKRHQPIIIDSINFQLENHTNQEISERTKKALIERLQKAIAQSFESEGFEVKSGTELEKVTGLTRKQMVDGIIMRMPFAMRDRARTRLSSDIIIMLSDTRPRCARNGNGALIAYLFFEQPLPDKKSDFGSLGLVLAGIASCSRVAVEATKTYMKGLIEEVTEVVSSSLQRKENSF